MNLNCIQTHVALVRMRKIATDRYYNSIKFDIYLAIYFPLQPTPHTLNHETNKDSSLIAFTIS